MLLVHGPHIVTLVSRAAKSLVTFLIRKLTEARSLPGFLFATSMMESQIKVEDHDNETFI